MFARHRNAAFTTHRVKTYSGHILAREQRKPVAHQRTQRRYAREIAGRIFHTSDGRNFGQTRKRCIRDINYRSPWILYTNIGSAVDSATALKC